MYLKDKKLFLLDMDGTIYLDNNLFDGTIDFLNEVKSQNKRYLFLTNNSSKGITDYVEKLNSIGIPAVSLDFLTSTDVTAIYINKHYHGKKFYCSGTKSFIKQLKESGVSVTEHIDDDIFGIILANDQEITFKKLEDICKLLTRDNIVYIATNPDWVCPTAFGYVPDCGSFADIIRRATGKVPKFLGKPNPEMILLALEKFGYSKDECVMIGDRLYTDIASGYNSGVETVLVLSGESTREDVEKSEIKPTYITDGIKDIYLSII